MSSMIDALRCELDLVTLKTEDLPHIKRISDARMFRVPVGKATIAEQRAIYARAVSRQIEAEPYQVVHVLDPWAGEVSAQLKGQRQFVLIYEVTTFPDGDTDDWIAAHAATLASADRVLVATEAMRDVLEADEAVAGRVDVVRPGVDVGGYDWGTVGPFAVPRVLYLGAFTEARDIETLLDALVAVAEHRPIRALLAGDRSSVRRSALREAVRARGLDDVVDVRGEPKPYVIPAIVAASDVCVAPAAGDTVAGCAELPQPLLEYFACYRPVVAASVPGVSELVRDEVEGLLYPPGRATALADAINEVLRDAELRESLADAAYRRVRDELNSGARRRRIREIYELVAPGSQIHDPWQEEFEDYTGVIELEPGAFDFLSDDDDPDLHTLAPPAPDTETAETRAPSIRPGEQTRPRVEVPTDTRPGLQVPDTDPGRS